MQFFFKDKKKTVLIVTICLVLIFYFYFIHSHITLENFKKNKDLILHFVHNHFYSSIILYSLSYILIVALSLPIALAMSIIGGFLFGPYLATLTIVISATIGATISFLIVRYLAGSYFQKKYQHELIIFNKEFEQYGAYYLLLVHLFPFIPFFIINVVSGLTKVSLATFIITTALGIIPTTVLYTILGHQIALLESYPTNSGTLLILFTIVAFVLLLFFIIFRKRKNNRKLPR